MHNPLTGNVHFFIALLFAGVLRYCIDVNRKHPILSAAPLVVFGGMTYELYCFHFPIRYAVNHYIQNDVLLVLIALFATLVVSLLWKNWAMPIVNKILR